LSQRRRSVRDSGGNGGHDARAADLRRHLDLEDPDTTSVEVARLWLKAYSELVTFEEKILDRLNKLTPALSERARREAELTNLPMIVQHLQTFRYRRAHWRQRLTELNGH
jgi:hypothetical protein